MKNRRRFLLPLVAAIFLFWADGVSSVAAAPQAKETEDFRVFLRRFFHDREFQMERIRFPLPRVTLNAETRRKVTEKISRSAWEFLPGPESFRCRTDCFDIVLYDNFERKWRNDSRRVVAFEGVANGINSALYFLRQDKGWVLVRFVDLSV